MTGEIPGRIYSGMDTYRVLYETPMDPGNHTEMTHSDEVQAGSLTEAIKKSLDLHVKAGRITLTGIDLVDSFHGLDRDTYERGKQTEKKFREKVRAMLKSVRKVSS